jgi:hypothetical protein
MMSFKVQSDSEQTNSSDEVGGTEKWMWCQFCQKCFHHGEHRLVKGIQLCPYDECMGLIFINSWPWSRIQKIYPNDYPEIPERDVIYPNSLL